MSRQLLRAQGRRSHRRGPRASLATKIKRRLKLGLLLVASVVLGLALCEVGASIYYRTRCGSGTLMMLEPYGSPYIFASKPNVVVTDNGVEYRINNRRMRRNADVTATPREGIVRILSYGDSIANGWKVRGNETYSQVLEAGLNERAGRRYEVLNMYRGVAPTITSFHIRRDVPILKPHGLVIEIELLNDVSDEANTQTLGRDELGLPREIRRARYVLGWDGHLLYPLPLAGSVLERTKTWALASRAGGLFVSFFDKGSVISEDSGVFYYHMGFDRFLLTERAVARGFDQMFESLKAIHRFLESRGVRFLLIIIPSKYAYAHGRYHDMALEQVRRAETSARRLEIPYVSVYEALDKAGGESLFMDFCHPGGDGHRAIAQAIYPIISQW